MDPDLNFAALALLQILLSSEVTREGKWELYKNIKLNPCSQPHVLTPTKPSQVSVILKFNRCFSINLNPPNLTNTITVTSYRILTFWGFFYSSVQKILGGGSKCSSQIVMQIPTCQWYTHSCKPHRIAPNHTQPSYRGLR